MNCRPHLRFIALSTLLFLLVVTATQSFAGSKVSRPADLAVVEGRISSYSLLDDSKGIHQYTIHLSEYPTTTFQIPPDFADYFARGRFESNVMKGDTLSVSISVDSASRLASGGIIPVFAARTKTATYLDEHYTLNAHDDELNTSPKNNADSVKNVASSSQQSGALTSTTNPLFAIAIVVVLIGALVGIAVGFIIWKSKNKAAPASGPDKAFLSESSQRMKQIVTKGKLRESEPAPAFSECTLEQIPVVFEHLKQKGHNGSFVIFTFQPSATSNPDDAINIQFSIANGRMGLDWHLNSPANIRDKDKLEGFIATQGQRAQLLETNQHQYFRVEQGNLPLLCQGVIIELYAMRFDVRLDMVVQGFPWPPGAPPLISAGKSQGNSPERAAAQPA